MKDEWKQAIEEMQRAGYAVIVWSPEELGDVPAEDVETASIGFAVDYLITTKKDAK